MDIEMDCVAPKEHEVAAEHDNGTHQEWFCAALHHTPHECVPINVIDVVMTVLKDQTCFQQQQSMEFCLVTAQQQL